MKKFLLILLILLSGFSFAQAETDERAYIESVLNLANHPDQEWTYSQSADAWTLSVVSAVAYPELPDQQGVSVYVPGAYVTGIDINSDGTDMMYGKHVNGAAVVKPAALQTADGTAAEPTGTDLSNWVDADDLSSVDFSLADVLAYRNRGATKAVPGFDVIDHSQENYVFGNASEDARHWNVFLNDIFQNE